MSLRVAYDCSFSRCVSNVRVALFLAARMTASRAQTQPPTNSNGEFHMSFRRTSIFATAIIAVIAGVATPGSAFAASGDASGDQGVAAPAPPFTKAQLAVMRQKQELADRYAAAKRGQGSVSDIKSETALLFGASAVQNNAATGVASPMTYYYNAAPIQQQPQIKDYYCGPGTAYAILKGKGKTTSAYNGQSLSQTVLASTTYLWTEAKHGTDWSGSEGYPMQTTLNRWEGTSWYSPVGAPNLSTYENYLSFDVDNTYAMAANVVEVANGTHLPGHPTYKTIYHWVAAYGYDAPDGVTASVTYYADPAGQSQAVSWGMGVYQYNNVPSSTMDYLVGQRGIIW